MQFELWSFWHYLYMISPFLIMGILYWILKNKSEKTKYIVGVVIGCLSLAILVIRNVDIYMNGGFSTEIIPLQVCHFGNIMVFLALVFKSKISTSILWCLNLVCAYSSLIVADSLANYSSVLEVRALAYIFGHLFIVVGALYAVIMKIVRIDKKSFLRGTAIVFLLLFISIIANSYFNDVMGYSSNYFYIYNYNGVPFEFLYIGARSVYGWFTIHWIYTFGVLAIALPIYIGFYYLQKSFYRKDINYNTHNIFSKKQ